jgi:pantoate--beta-alanine ligase
MFYLLKQLIQMKILLNNEELKKELINNHNLGFVPTMGSIHKGHEYLIMKCRKECKKTLISIFINPTQFNNIKDLKNYPQNIKKDLSILKKLKVDYVFLPNVKDIYAFKRKEKIRLNKRDLVLCARYRRGHFVGVLDVMDRLTKLIAPNKIYMGEKDFQQYYFVKKFLEHKYKTKVIKCNTIRSFNMVALSSRNLLLDQKNILKAGRIIKELIKLKKIIPKNTKINQYLLYKKKDLVKKYKIKIEYLELRSVKDLKKSNTFKNSKIFIAYYLNKIRLIDNL